jgi:hypothetical protein
MAKEVAQPASRRHDHRHADHVADGCGLAKTFSSMGSPWTSSSAPILPYLLGAAADFSQRREPKTLSWLQRPQAASLQKGKRRVA